MRNTRVPLGRTRPHRIQFRVNDKEKELIEQKLKNSGFATMERFIRKILLTGYVVNLDLEPVNKIVSLLSHCSNNLNQLARRANSYEAITNEDMESIKKLIKELHDTNKLLLNKIGSL